MINRLSKILIFIIILYFEWYMYVVGPNSAILYISALSLFALVIMDLLINKRGVLELHFDNAIVRAFIVLGVYAAIVGAFVATDKQLLYTSLLQYLEYVFICLACCYIANKEHSMNWLFDIIAVCALICAVTTIFWGKNITTAGVIVKTLDATNNPNTLGIVLLMGIFSTVFRYERMKNRFFLSMASVVTIFYAIVLCGSRKVFLMATFILIVWVLCYILNVDREGKKANAKDVGQKLLLIIGFLFALVLLSNRFNEFSVAEKLLRLFTGDDVSSNMRVSMYELAWQFFLKNPLFGIGYRQFEVLSPYGIYSHSTYAEIISCTGIIGAIIFFTPIIALTIGIMKRAIKKQNRYSYEYRMLFSMILAILFLSAVVITIYSLIEMTMIVCISWEFNRIKNLENTEIPTYGKYMEQ